MKYDVLVIGGGPAGMAAAATAAEQGKSTLLLEREKKTGGILKQCVHDGFGIIRYNERLTGPEYAYEEERELFGTDAKVVTEAFVVKLSVLGEKDAGEGFETEYVTPEGAHTVRSERIVLATGCRERTAKQIFIGGQSSAGILTAGTAQHYINIMGLLPARKCVILGSGDIGLIMARRLTLEGIEVEGVYEIKSEPGGLTRNIVQCLDDYNIPLYLNHTVTRVFGSDRVTGVEVARVDEKGNAIDTTRRKVDCDALILSVGLIPENEIAAKLGVPLDPATGGPVVDQTLMTKVRGVYSCGNCLHVNDLADYVSESGTIAGGYASVGMYPLRRVKVTAAEDMAYVIPQYVNMDAPRRVIFYFRVKREIKNAGVTLFADGKKLAFKYFGTLRPPEMARWETDVKGDFTQLSFGISEESVLMKSEQETEKNTGKVSDDSPEY